MKNITIIGFGNVGKSLIHQLMKNFKINILTFSKNIKSKKVITLNNGNVYENFVEKITTEVEILKETEIVIISVPNFLRKYILIKIKKYLKKETIILFIPGIGPSQFIANKYLKKYTVLCLERVPYITRSKGEIVEITDSRSVIKYATLNTNYNYDELIKKMFEKPVEKIPYYMVTLTSSNAILHTTRIFSIFKGNENKIFDREILFYSEWDDESSYLFQKCDLEIMSICSKLKKMGLINKEIQPLMEYYESKTPKELTKKLNSINSLRNIKLDMKKLENNQYILDKNIRFIIEDIPYGLIMFKGIAELVGEKTPNIDKIIIWAQTLLNKKYLIDNKLNNLVATGAPQNFEIKTLEELKKVFYE